MAYMAMPVSTQAIDVMSLTLMSLVNLVKLCSVTSCRHSYVYWNYLDHPSLET